MSTNKSSTARTARPSSELAALTSAIEDLLVAFPHVRLNRDGGALEAARYLNLRLAARGVFLTEDATNAAA